MKKFQTKRNAIIETVTEKCPKCGTGNTFKKNNRLFKIPQMHPNCPSCGFKFEREPGYFIGAMYVSYGLAVLLGIVTFLSCSLMLPFVSIATKTGITLFAILLFSKTNFKWSRLIYLRIAP